jgi:hypothetical protein
MIGIGGFGELQPGDFDRTSRQFDGFAVAGKVIGALALDLDSGIARRNLLDAANEAGQQSLDRLGGGPFGARLNDPALRVVRVALLPQRTVKR